MPLFSTVRGRFLAVIAVALLLVAGAGIAALLVIERESAARQLRLERGLLVRQLADILAEPVWNMVDSTVDGIAAAALRDPRYECLTVEDSTRRQVLSFGACGRTDGLERFEADLRWTNPDDSPAALGRLVAWADVRPDAGDLLTQAGLRIALFTAALVATLVAAGLAFDRLVGRPLAVVHRSLRHYRDTGERERIGWTSRDELGTLIADYNAMLDRGAEAERTLRAERDRTEAAYADLKRAQAHLVQSEKMASLGSLVAGIAHEINTPVGTAVTVASSLGDRCRAFRAAVEANALKKSMLLDFVAGAEEASVLLNRSLAVAHDLIHSFKQVSADQTSDQRRRFDLAHALAEIVSTLRPRLRRASVEATVDVPPGIAMDSYPGPLGQIVTNLVMNAIVHAFPEERGGTVAIAARTEGADVVLTLADDGQGIPPAVLPRIFDPFFTTKLGAGGTGLGLSLVYTLATQTLRGRVTVDSEPGVGTRFTLVLPLTVESAALEVTHV